ncbi:MAG: flavin reductase [Bacteroidaceae bacterium]|nr:flavin reductase [Bacteroidaceae bacterium]
MKSFGQKPWVLPQPVLIIGTYNSDGTPNAMNAAWGGQWDSKEIMICMGSHATTENLARCNEFTVAFATKETMVESDFVGIVSAKNDPQKIQKTKWTAIKAENVNAPVFTNFPMTLECRIVRKIDETTNGYNLIAEIINILVDEAFLDAEGKPDVNKMQLITYEPVRHSYHVIGERVGNAFSDGKQLSRNPLPAPI